MRKSILSLSIAFMVGAAACLSAAATSCRRAAASACDYVVTLFAPREPVSLPQLHAPSTWVAPVRAFVGRIANRFRPLKTPGWSLCPSA